MTLRFDWLHAPRWLANAHRNRAMTLVLGVIGVSLLFGALRVLDVAFSGAPVVHHAVAVAPAAPGPDLLIDTDPEGAGAKPVDVEEVVPEASAEAISL
jgi:hypothetical protein